MGAFGTAFAAGRHLELAAQGFQDVAVGDLVADADVHELSGSLVGCDTDSSVNNND
jgi:hypothetical protein